MELGALSEEALARWRARHVGIVFQFFQLLPTLTALENVILPMEFAGREGDRRAAARALLASVGLAHLADHLQTQSTEHWLSILQPADIWCAKVFDYDMLRQEEAYQALDMELEVKTSNGLSITTTRCPLRIDGERLASDKGAPLLGEHNRDVELQFGLV